MSAGGGMINGWKSFARRADVTFDIKVLKA